MLLGVLYCPPDFNGIAPQTMHGLQGSGNCRGSPHNPLAARQHLTFPGVLDACALLPAPAFRGFLVLLVAPQFPEEARFLYLPFEETQRKLHIVVLHLDSKHRITHRATGPGDFPQR